MLEIRCLKSISFTIRLTLVALVGLSMSFAHGDDSAIGLLTGSMSKVETLQGQFKQLQFAEDGELLSESEGEFWLNSPNKLHWYTKVPFEQQLISDGERLWLYEPDLEQVTVSSVDEYPNAPSMILGGDVEKIAQSYLVQQSEDGFEFRPKSDGVFSVASITFKAGLPSNLSILDTLGQRTVIEFSNAKADLPINDSKFEFIPGPDIDILGQSD